MKKQQLILSNPCAERWDDMQASEAGRYCEKCEKHIVDLTEKSDAELIQFFKKKNNNTCGRLLDHQLNRELVVPRQKLGWQWMLPLAIGAMVLSTAHAATLRPLTEQHDPKPGRSDFPLDAPVKTDVIKGTVLDQRTGKPLQGVKLRQKGFENVLAITDSLGKFQLSLPNTNASTIFTFELKDYMNVEMPVTDQIVVKMPALVRIMLGGVSAVHADREPMYLVYSGKKKCTINASKLKEIPPSWIEKIDIMKGNEATALYGSKAVNGIILIGIHKTYAKQFDFSTKQ